MSLTIKDKARYIGNGGTQCPFCGSEHMNAGHLESDGDRSAYQPVTCDECGSSWDDVYELVGIEERES